LVQVDRDGRRDYSNTIRVVAEADVMVYPNPARDALWVASEGMEGKEFRLVDGAGRTLLEGRLGAGGIDVSGIPPGLYVLLVDPAGRHIARFVVKE